MYVLVHFSTSMVTNSWFSCTDCQTVTLTNCSGWQKFPSHSSLSYLEYNHDKLGFSLSTESGRSPLIMARLSVKTNFIHKFIYSSYLEMETNSSECMGTFFRILG